MSLNDGYSARSNAPGVVLFDSATKRDLGWACYAGERPFQIGGTHELSSAGVWMCNLNQGEFRSSGLEQSNRFRMYDYLRTNLTQIAVEMGYATTSGKYSQAVGGNCAAQIAQIFGNVLDVSWRLGVHGFPPTQLRIGFRNVHYLNDQPPLPPELAVIMNDAHLRYGGSERRLDSRSKKYTERAITFVRHRYEHAHEVVTQMVPYGAWRTAPRMSSNEICQHPAPLLIEVEVHKTDEVIGRIVNFGGAKTTRGPNNVEAKPRRWLTQPEFMFLAPFAQISIISIREGESYQPNPLMNNLPFFQDAQKISPACLLAIESYWMSALRTGSGATDLGVIATWMSSYDRIACLRDAVTLVQTHEDIDIINYGSGQIHCNIIDPGEMFGSWLGEAVRHTLLIPPMAISAPAAFKISDPDPSPVEVLQCIQISGDSDLYETLDKAAIEAWDEASFSEDMERGNPE